MVVPSVESEYSVPAFAAYGLVKGAFIATEAAGSLALYISKAATFHTFGALPGDIVVKGLITGSSVMAGTYAARLVVERLRDGGDVLGRVAAAATGDVDQAVLREVREAVRHVGGFEVEARR